MTFEQWVLYQEELKHIDDEVVEIILKYARKAWDAAQTNTVLKYDDNRIIEEKRGPPIGRWPDCGPEGESQQEYFGK